MVRQGGGSPEGGGVSEQDERVGRLAAEERLRRVRAAVSGYPARTWSQDIHAWQVATFGETSTPLAAFTRAWEEWDELEQSLNLDTISDRAHCAEECADVAIVLCRVASALGFDLADAIEKKMAKNRARTWLTPGDGTGQHIEGGT